MCPFLLTILRNIYLKKSSELIVMSSWAELVSAGDIVQKCNVIISLLDNESMTKGGVGVNLMSLVT